MFICGQAIFKMYSLLHLEYGQFGFIQLVNEMEHWRYSVFISPKKQQAEISVGLDLYTIKVRNGINIDPV